MSCYRISHSCCNEIEAMLAGFNSGGKEDSGGKEGKRKLEETSKS